MDKLLDIDPASIISNLENFDPAENEEGEKKYIPPHFRHMRIQIENTKKMYSGDLEAAKIALYAGGEFCILMTPTHLSVLAQLGHLNIIKWFITEPYGLMKSLQNMGIDGYSLILEAANKKNQTEIVEYIRSLVV